jgi:hypothetical protein
MALDKGQVKRGFKAFRGQVKNDRNAMRRIRSCKTCGSNYPSEESEEDTCHNNSVTSFDMVTEGDTTYCTFWTPSWEKE